MRDNLKIPDPQPTNKGPGHVQSRRASVPVDHWQGMSRVWELTGPPLRPSGEDIAFYTKAVDSWVRDRGAPRVLILGVTPELYSLPWPAGTNIMALDHTKEMIDTVWPGPRNTAVCADWTALPLQTGSRDIVLCDGGVHLVVYPGDHRQLVRTLHRVVASGGVCIFRLFVPPRKREAVDDVLGNLLEAKIANLNILKLRLGMALQKDSSEGIELKRIWDTIHRVAPDFDRLASRIGWPMEHLLAINTYRNSPVRYYFLTPDDVCRVFCENPGGFTLETVNVPSYELGERCPTVVLARNERLLRCDPTGNVP